MDNLYSILSEWYPEGEFTESELWDAIAESEGVDVSEIMDGDLTEYLQRSKIIRPTHTGVASQ